MRWIALLVVLLLSGCRSFEKVQTLNVSVSISPVLQLQGTWGGQVAVEAKR